jgi:hypothetical protein
MASVLVDCNVLLDVLGEENAWTPWSAATIAKVANTGRLIINPVIYGEVSVRFSSVEALDEALPAATFLRERYPSVPPFSPARHSSHTAAEVAPGIRCSLTS